jgi:hypothetical protein
MLGKPESPPPGHGRPRDTERRHRDLCPGKRRQKFSVTVNIAVPVEAATEPGALEFTGVEVDIRLVSQFGRVARFTNSLAQRARRPPCRGTIIAVGSRGGASPEIE